MNIDRLSSLSLKGFLDEEEALRLYELAKDASRRGPCLEIGSYCGKSTAYLGFGCRENGGVLYSIDHHRGSEEQQQGQEYFDPDLWDKATGQIDTFKIFRATLTTLGLEDTVVPIVTKSMMAARQWRSPLSLLFIDGGHTFESAYFDYSNWACHLIPGGYLAVHDIFPDATNGGQAPHCIYDLAVASGLFVEMPKTKTLGVLRRAFRGEVTEAAAKKWRELN